MNEKVRSEFLSPGEITSDPTLNKSLRIGNAASTVKTPPVKIENFRKRIDQILESEEEQKRTGLILIQSFFKMIDEKTLDATKTAAIRENEKQVIKDIMDFARLLNSDENQVEENYGSMSLFQVLFLSLVKQRDRINTLEYKLEKLSKTSK